MIDKAGLGNLFRINDWWASKAALLMGLVYLYAAWFNIPFERMIVLSLLSVSTVSGFAAVGYLCNDLFDREKDVIAGKRNFLVGKSAVQIAFFYVVAFVLLVFPWKYLPATKFSVAIIVAELLLFFLYSVKPFRFKERAKAGVITDALYAHVVPAFLSLYTFSLAAEYKPAVLPVIVLLMWQLASGIRNILLHQQEDINNDARAGVKNSVSIMSPSTYAAYLKILIGAELAFSALLYVFLAPANLLFLFCPGLIIFFSVMVGIVFYNPGFSAFLQSRWKYFPNQVFEKWLPVASLCILARADWRFLLLGLVHITVFNFAFYTQLNHILGPAIKGGIMHLKNTLVYRVLIPIRILMSRGGNYFIYYLLRLFNIDLRKEQTSAVQYFKNRRKKH